MENVEVSLPNDDNLCEWEIVLSGPEDTPYHNGKFRITFTYPETYPFKAPMILFKTKIYHPNIKSETGEICAQVLYDEWGPTLNARHCLTALQELLKNPNADSPLEEEAAALYREKPKEFEKVVKKWVKDYASA